MQGRNSGPGRRRAGDIVNRTRLGAFHRGTFRQQTCGLSVVSRTAGHLPRGRECCEVDSHADTAGT